MELKHFSKTVLNKLSEKNISLNEFARRMNISRPGLQKMLDNINSIKLDSFLKICQLLKIEPLEYLGNEESVWTADHIIDRNQIKQLDKVLEAKGINLNEAATLLGYDQIKFKNSINNCELEPADIFKTCAIYNFPFQLFYKEQYKTEFKGIKPTGYLKHQRRIENSNKYLQYLSYLDKVKTEIIDLVNSAFKKDHNIINQDFDYQELIYSNNEYSSFLVSIFAENCNKPAVLISNNPNHILSTQPNIEILTQNIYDKFFTSRGIEIGDIIWIELTYSSKDSININLVKSESNTEFTNPQWLTIKGYYDRNIKIEPKKVKEFLN